MQDSKIAWTHHTVNPWWGCHAVSPACDHCYARTLARRTAFAKTAFDGGPYHIRTDKAIAELRALDRKAMAAGHRRRVFVESMGDLFEDQPFLQDAQTAFLRAAVRVEMLDLLFLTKRPENIIQVCGRAGLFTLPANIWLGITAESTTYYRKRWPILCQAAETLGTLTIQGVARYCSPVHTFVSCEPMLGALNIQHVGRIPEWIIVGCEKIGNQPGRYMNPYHVAELRFFCFCHAVPIFVKQTVTDDGKHVTDDPSQFARGYPHNREFPASLNY